jgi:uncharacterized SAM-binding protein YcdF (DUF218 family)
VKADAIVVLGGRSNRLPVGLRLHEEGVAPVLLVFNASGSGDAGHLYERPDPYTTRGEARAIARLAAEHGWRSVVVVTSGYHVPRAGLIVRRAFDGDVQMVGAPSWRWRLPLDLATEVVKGVYALTLGRAP